MIPRYEHPDIVRIFDDASKIARWDTVELAVIEARSRLGSTPVETYEKICTALKSTAFDLEAWYALEKELGHDLGAYVELRQQALPPELQYEFHKDTTSYDIED
ncbi:hypothetical protein HY091_02620, partial [Candidatus Kaiserbacteria bacterium]|nr:hypothetical protein [Candidatus Kaiserbacteria bacterium]